MFHFETMTFEPNEMNNIRNHSFIDKFVLNVFSLKNEMPCFVETNDLNRLQLTLDEKTSIVHQVVVDDELGTLSFFLRRLLSKVSVCH